MKHSLAFLLAFGSVLACGSAAAADVYTPGGDKDPRVRTAQYLAGNKRFLDASAMLAQVQSDAPQSRLAPTFYRDLADDTLNYGMPARAELIYREQAASSDRGISSRARLRLADFYYQRGYFQKATAELTGSRPQLPRELLVDWQDLMSRVLMAQGRYGEAADILLQADSGPPAQTEFMHYNLGVALIKDGRVGQGENMLDRVGRLSPTDSDTIKLRDKANLALGYHFLESDQGRTAIPILGRVSSEGPSSNHALLWLGWAYLAPPGDRQKKAAVGDEAPDQGAYNSFATIGVLLRPGYINSDSIYISAAPPPARKRR
jgi:tetratricopeptide (TPR) repeat protein